MLHSPSFLLLRMAFGVLLIIDIVSRQAAAHMIPDSPGVRLRKRASFPDPDPFQSAARSTSGDELDTQMYQATNAGHASHVGDAVAPSASHASIDRYKTERRLAQRRSVQQRYINQPDKLRAKREHDRARYHADPQRREKIMTARVIREALKFQEQMDNPAAKKAADEAKAAQLARRRERYRNVDEETRERRRMDRAIRSAMKRQAQDDDPIKKKEADEARLALNARRREKYANADPDARKRRRGMGPKGIMKLQ